MENLEYRSEVEASDVLRDNMRTFSRHTIKEYMPHEVDGLKLVHRRVLQAILHGEKKYKEAALIGETMKLYHPHGDGAIKDAIDRLCQPFNQAVPLIDSPGNVGAYSGGAAAAARYLDIIISQFSEDVFFRNVNLKTLEYIPKEDDDGVELSHFVPVIPMSLIMGPSSITVAYRSNIPYYNFTDVCNLTIEFIKARKKYPMDYMKKYKLYAKYLIPDFPIYGYLLNSRQVMEEYKRGNYGCKFITCGTMDLSPNCVNIHSIPFGIDFYNKVWLNLREQMKKASFVVANYTEVLDLTNNVDIGNVELPLKRGTSPFEALDQLKKEVFFRQSWTPIWNFCSSDEYLVNRNPLELLELWYTERYRSIMADLKMTNMTAVNEYRKITALIIICDHAKEVADLFLKSKCKEDTVEPLSKRYGLSLYQAKFIASLQISQFTSQGKDELLQRLEEVKAKLKELQNRFMSIDELMIKQIAHVRDKYTGTKSKRKTKVPNFIGAIKINDDGYIQYESFDEMVHILKKWEGRAITTIVPYPEYKDNFTRDFTKYYREGKAYRNDKDLDLQKEIATPQLFVASDNTKYTVVTHKDKTVSRLDGILGSSEKGASVVYAFNEMSAIDNDWKVQKLKTTDIAKRVNVLAQGNKSDWKFLSPTIIEDDCIVVHANTKDPNQIVFERLKPGEKMTRKFFGSTVILGIYKTTDTVLMTVPMDIIQRCNIRHILIGSMPNCANLGVFMGNEKKVILSLNKKNTTNNLTMKSYSKDSSVLIVG